MALAENKNFVRNIQYRGLEFTAPVGGVLGGNFILIADTWGLSLQTLTEGDSGLAIYECEDIEIPKTTGAGTAILPGNKLYLNTTTKTVSSTDGGSDILVGVAEIAAGDNDAYVKGNFYGGGYA